MGGDEPTGRLELDAIADVLRAHGDPLGYADRLADPALRSSVRGYLTGSIDLVARAGGPLRRRRLQDERARRPGRGADGLALPAGGAGRRDACARHYGLQALLYTVALHRYLRWRLPGYDPDRHLAGVGYLFLRGMTGGPAPACSRGGRRRRSSTALSDVLETG